MVVLCFCNPTSSPVERFFHTAMDTEQFSCFLHYGITALQLTSYTYAAIQFESLQEQITVNCFTTSPLQTCHVLSCTEVPLALICNFTSGTFPANLEMPSQNDVMRFGSKETEQFVIVQPPLQAVLSIPFSIVVLD